MNFIKSIDWRGTRQVLINRNTHAAVRAGDKLKTRAEGFEYTITGGRAPHKPSSSGKVWVEGGEFFPSVFDLEWADDNGD